MACRCTCHITGTNGYCICCDKGGVQTLLEPPKNHGEDASSELLKKLLKRQVEERA